MIFVDFSALLGIIFSSGLSKSKKWEKIFAGFGVKASAAKVGRWEGLGLFNIHKSIYTYVGIMMDDYVMAKEGC